MYGSPALCETPAVATLPAPWDSIAGRNRREQDLRPHEALFCEGDDAGSLYEVMDGVMCNYRILSDGRRQVISFAYPGDLIGLGHSATHRFGCEAISGARVRSTPRIAFLRDAEGRSDITHRLLEIATTELADMQEHQLLLGRKSAVEKVASFLLTLVHRSGRSHPQQPHLRLPMTRADIADFLGLTIETVSRNMTKLRVMGIIDLPQPATVIIRDMDRLEDLADGEERPF